MNARLQQMLWLIRVLAGGVALFWGWRAGAMWQGLLLFLVLGWGWTLLLLLPRFFFAGAEGRGPNASGLRHWGRVLRAWALEVCACERVFSWQQPFAAKAQADHLPPHSAQRGVLLLHGFTCNRGLWNSWLQALRQRGQPCIALTLEPAFGSIDGYVEAIEAAIARLEQCSPGLAPVIVAHSMGGLAARAWLRRTGQPGRVRRIITLGSPHAGTRLARWAHTANGRQMRRHSDWLKQLAASESAALYRQFDCIYSEADQVVYPADTAVLPGSRALHLAAVGHLGLVFAPQSYATLLQYLDDGA